MTGSSGATTRATFIEETIYDKPIGLENIVDPNSANIQVIITIVITQYIRENPPLLGTPSAPSLIGPLGPPRQSRGGSTNYFRPRDVGYFDPNLDIPLVEVKDTYNIYYNVFSFTNRLRVKSSTIDVSLLR